jgi:hypothetical protein
MSVVPIQKGMICRPGEASHTVVDYLREKLEQAERGEIIAIAVAYVSPGSATSCGFATSGGTSHPLASAVLMLHADIARRLLDGEI